MTFTPKFPQLFLLLVAGACASGEVAEVTTETFAERRQDDSGSEIVTGTFRYVFTSIGRSIQEPNIISDSAKLSMVDREEVQMVGRLKAATVKMDQGVHVLGIEIA